MQILTVDIGTGTQDIFLYDARIDIENCFKMVLPSPTMMVASKIKKATQRKENLILTGVTMGGGPSHWAAEEHLKSGLQVLATPSAARSFDDDLQSVLEMGIKIIGEEEARKTGTREGYAKIELKDFDFNAIQAVFDQFGVDLGALSAIAVAVFDHGNAPPGYSDRQFRFDYLDRRIRSENRLSAFAYPSSQIPPIMTRLQAVAQSAIKLSVPLFVMDTAPAAVLGALHDPFVRQKPSVLVTNVGNFHTLAFLINEEGIAGVFEHHTGLINQQKLEDLLVKLASGTLQHADVFDDHGHGALVYNQNSIDLAAVDERVIVTGPRRKLMEESRLNPYFAAPFGDMMISGCFGLLSAVADLSPELSTPIRASLHGQGGSGTPPWEV